MSQGVGSGAEPDVLQLDGRRGWSARTWVAVSGVLAAVLAVGWVVEDRARASAEETLAACSTQAQSALERQTERFEFMADYLRPAMLALPVDGRDSLYGLMSRTAAEMAPPVRDALETCRRVDPAWYHPDLTSRRDALVDHLAATVTLLEAIETDGRQYYQDTPELDAARRELFPDA
jgi:hypothetical protein